MAPSLAPSKHELTYDMIYSGEPCIIEMAQAAGCDKSTISSISSNIRMLTPPTKGGRLHMLDALCDHLIESLPYVWTRQWLWRPLAK